MPSVDGDFFFLFQYICLLLLCLGKLPCLYLAVMLNIIRVCVLDERKLFDTSCIMVAVCFSQISLSQNEKNFLLLLLHSFYQKRVLNLFKRLFFIDTIIHFFIWLCFLRSITLYSEPGIDLYYFISWKAMVFDVDYMLYTYKYMHLKGKAWERDTGGERKRKREKS